VDVRRGVVFAAAVSVKLTPVVVAPLLLVVLARAGGWRRIASFTGGLVLFLPLWAPAVLFSWTQFSANVLGYPGIAVRRWGLPQFLAWAERPVEWTTLLIGPGRFVALVISAALPAVLVWLRRAVSPAVGLCLALFLLLSPAFGMQYRVWPLAAAYLVDTRAATYCNATASLFVISVYDNWNGAAPWQWYEAKALLFRYQELLFMAVTWAALAFVVVVALRCLRPEDHVEPAAEPTSTRRSRNYHYKEWRARVRA
jgi:hypothetical protein